MTRVQTVTKQQISPHHFHLFFTKHTSSMLIKRHFLIQGKNSAPTRNKPTRVLGIVFNRGANLYDYIVSVRNVCACEGVCV